MRIWIDFQYAERNYTRFITYDKAAYEGDKFSLAGYFYSENDAKNQPIQQNLTDAQKQILNNWEKYKSGKYDQKTIKKDDPASVDTMYEWYLDQGGKKFDTKDGLKEAGIGNYNSNNDAKKFGSYLQDQLKYTQVPSLFGNLFTKKDYNAALNYENQDKKYIKNYLEEYMQKGGGVSDKVKNIFSFNRYSRLLQRIIILFIF